MVSPVEASVVESVMETVVASFTVAVVAVSTVETTVDGVSASVTVVGISVVEGTIGLPERSQEWHKNGCT